MGCLLSNGHFIRNVQFSIDKQIKGNIDNFRNKHNNTDIYYSVFLKEENTKNIIAPFYIDFDGEIGNNADLIIVKREMSLLLSYMISVFGLSANDFHIYFSGAKGFHLLVPPTVLNIKPSEDLNTIYKAIIIHFSKLLNLKHVDIKIYDSRRLFRFPNSINSKTGLYKVHLTHEQFNVSTIEDIKKIAAASSNIPETKPSLNIKAAQKWQDYVNKVRELNMPKEHKPIIIPKEKQPLPLCTKYLLQTAALQGNRNNTLVCIASTMAQNGYTLEEALNVLADWNQNNEPPIADHELSSTIKSAYSLLTNKGQRYGCSSYRSLLSIPAALCNKCTIKKS